MNELVKFNEVTAAIAEYKAENANLAFNYEDPEGNKDARSHIYKLRQVKTKIADIHRIAKAEALGVCRLLDSKKKELTGEVEEMIDVHYKPVKEIEERAARIVTAKIAADHLEQIRVEAERVAENERREEEIAVKEKALQDKEEALAREQEKLEAAKQAEIDKQEAVKTAQETAGRDKVEAAARVEQDKKDAQAAAEAEKQAAVDAIQEEARQIKANAEAEAQRIADAASQKAENELQAKIAADKAEAERVANQSHRDSIETDIMDYINGISSMAEELGHDVVEAIITAIIDNEIPNVTINY